MKVTKGRLGDFGTAELFREFMSRFGVDVDGEHFRETPHRVERMYEELLKGYNKPEFNFTTFEVKGTPSLVVTAPIPFHSLCSHHIMPFAGNAYVGYLPKKKLCGLSKLARTVHHFAAKLQVQEDLTGEIADYLEKELKPQGVMVVLKAEHFCMSMRGVKVAGSITTTSAVRGLFLEQSTLKEEFFEAVR